MTPESSIPREYIDSLNGMLSLLQRGQMEVETFREELANLSNMASEAGYKNTSFVLTLEKLNNESSGLLNQLAESDKGMRDINAALEQSAKLADSSLFAAPFRELLNLKISDSSNILFSGNSTLLHQDSDPGNMREDAPAKCVLLLLQAKSL